MQNIISTKYTKMASYIIKNIGSHLHKYDLNPIRPLPTE